MGQSSLKQSTARLQAFLDSRTRSPRPIATAPNSTPPVCQGYLHTDAMPSEAALDKNISPPVPQSACPSAETTGEDSIGLACGQSISTEHTTTHHPQAQAQEVIALPPPVGHPTHDQDIHAQDPLSEDTQDQDSQCLDTQAKEKRCSQRKSTAPTLCLFVPNTMPALAALSLIVSKTVRALPLVGSDR